MGGRYGGYWGVLGGFKGAFGGDLGGRCWERGCHVASQSRGGGEAVTWWLCRAVALPRGDAVALR